MDEWSVEYVERLRNQLNKGKQGTDVPALGALIRIIDHLDKQLTDTQAPAMRALLERVLVWYEVRDLDGHESFADIITDIKAMLKEAKVSDG